MRSLAFSPLLVIGIKNSAGSVGFRERRIDFDCAVYRLLHFWKTHIRRNHSVYRGPRIEIGNPDLPESVIRIQLHGLFKEADRLLKSSGGKLIPKISPL